MRLQIFFSKTLSLCANFSKLFQTIMKFRYGVFFLASGGGPKGEKKTPTPSSMDFSKWVSISLLFCFSHPSLSGCSTS
jgi:hypothetical protein